MTMKALPQIGLLGLALVLLAVRPGALSANSVGIVGYSGKDGFICNVCHLGGTAPNVAFGGPMSVRPGTTSTFTFTVVSNAPARQVASGLDVAVSDGTLIAAELDEQVLGNELAHTQPKDNDPTGRAVWSFQWQAPSVSGTYALFGAGNSVNLDTTNGGDAAAGTMRLVRVVELPGDANCDARVAAADLPGLFLEINQGAAATCASADANLDGRVDAGDLPATIAAIF